jgi:hypothetical protein
VWKDEERILPRLLLSDRHRDLWHVSDMWWKGEKHKEQKWEKQKRKSKTQQDVQHFFMHIKEKNIALGSTCRYWEQETDNFLYCNAQHGEVTALTDREIFLNCYSPKH